MKIAIALSRIPYPLDKGDKLRAYHQIKELIASGHEVTICCVHFENADPTFTQHLIALGGNWHFIRLSKLLAFTRIILNIFKKKPFQVALFHSKKAQHIIDSILISEKPDHLLSQLVRTSEYFKNHVAFKKSIDYMDALGYGLEKRAQSSSFIFRYALSEESQRMYRYENIIWNYYDNQFIISRKDALNIRIANQNHIRVLSNGIDSNYFDRTHHQLGDRILFTGNMGYPPNVDAALFLIQEIMPLVWQQLPKVILVIAGTDPHEKLLRVRHPQIEITGRVHDIRKCYEQAAIFVAPMRLGTGMQNKILEALSMQIPVVTTSIAAEAFNDEVQKTLLIANDSHSIANMIVQHYQSNHPAFENLRNIVVKEYNWQKIMQTFIQVIHEKN